LGTLATSPHFKANFFLHRFTSYRPKIFQPFVSVHTPHVTRLLGSAAFIKIGVGMKIDDSIMLKSGLLQYKKQRCGHQIVIGLTPLVMLQ
jgi:hypothetical protein